MAPVCVSAVSVLIAVSSVGRSKIVLPDYGASHAGPRRPRSPARASATGTPPARRSGAGSVAALGGLDLTLVVAAESRVAVGPQGGRVESHERELRDRQAGVQLDRHAREVVELERQRAAPAGVAEAGGGVH